MKGRWRSADRVEVELVKGQPGLGGQEVVPTMGERGEMVGGEMKRVDLRGTAGQEGWEVELLAPELGSEGVGGRQELVEAECHRGIPH